ncbi:MAG: FtsX-like permease family protein [Pyrinomonadaceae bacterium]|nr:FtsX-like permease family protein [Phycisphaerales bacterium]
MSERRSRTALLVLTVALCAALIAAVTCALASLNEGIRHRVGVTVGDADVRLQHVGKKLYDLSEMQRIQAWPGVVLAVPRASDSLTLVNPRTDKEFTPMAYGIDPATELKVRPLKLNEGRLIERTGEIVLDSTLAKELDAKLGDTVDVRKFGDPASMTVVGIAKAQLLGGLARPESFVTLEQLGLIKEWKDKTREIDVVLEKGIKPDEFVALHAGDFPQGLLLKTTSKITSGLYQSMESSQIGMALISSLAFLAASFIIMTGMTTGVTERQRELAVLRCIGGSRGQLAGAQLLVGVLIGSMGALLGVPAGVGAAALLVAIFPDQLPVGFAWTPLGIALSVCGAIGSGILGGVWPAVQAARTSPLSALSVRAQTPRRRSIVLCLILGLLGAGIHIAIISFNKDPRYLLYGDAFLGIPAMLSGYFLLAVPVTLVLAKLLSPLVSAAMRLPRGILSRTIEATPYRHGFTAAAMMVGLAMLVAIWTNGKAVMSDWLDTMKFPDAFVFGRNLTTQTQEEIAAIPGVTNTCAITLQHMNPRGLWDIANFRKNDTSFIAFEPEKFFEMAQLTFIEGDPETAKARLIQGNAILVAKEYKTAKGIGVGSTIDLTFEDKTFTFDVVGVVNSPGLEIVNSFFDIGEDYLQQSISAVFGSRKDLKEKFGNDAINLIQIAIDPAYDDAPIVKKANRIKGVIQAGSGRSIKEEIGKFLSGSMLVFSVIGIASMLVACMGVANLIVAGIQTRQFEFGVLRAIGAQRGMIARLVLAEALIIAASACVLGTVMGMQGAWAGQRVNNVLVGLELRRWLPPLDATAGGWLALTIITLAASGPAVWRLAQREPRELLAAMKG